jgi:hypothetical protein
MRMKPEVFSFDETAFGFSKQQQLRMKNYMGRSRDISLVHTVSSERDIRI